MDKEKNIVDNEIDINDLWFYFIEEKKISSLKDNTEYNLQKRIHVFDLDHSKINLQLTYIKQLSEINLKI